MKAVIPAAGLGTRFLPVTRVVPKEMLPIGARPALEHIVEEARQAGAEETVIVISEGKELIRKYFEGASDIRFVYQKEQKGLGHAVLQAAELFGNAVPGEKILILLGDAVVTGGCASAELAAALKTSDAAQAIGFERVPMEKVSRYGIAKMRSAPEGGVFMLDDLVEKPRVEDAPSDFAVAGRYLLDVSVFGFLAGQGAGYGGEIQLTDAIRRMISAGVESVGCAYSGRRQDIGNPEGYFKALEAYYGRC